MAGNVKSVSKSLLSAVYGLAMQQGHIRDLDQPMAELLPDLFATGGNDRLASIKVRHMMEMTAGFAWDDTSTLFEMLATEDWPAFVAARRFVANPGDRWAYSTGLTHVASLALAEATGESTREFAAKRLIEPLGVRITRWDHDPHGTHFGGAEVWMRPRDMARFGLLYLQEGTVDGSRVLPADWVRSSTEPTIELGDSESYGAWWWQRTFAGHESFFAWGYGGQFVFVVPELNMVVVATSDWHRPVAESTYDEVFDLMERFIVPAAQ